MCGLAARCLQRRQKVCCVIPVFKQDLPTVIDCFERALEFFGGFPRRIVVDGMKACIDRSDPYTPRFNRTFLEYATFQGFLPDPARPVHPKDKPVAGIMNRLREGFQAGFLQVSQLETNPFEKAVEAYTKIAERKTRTKQVLVFD
jgi:transposase